MPELVVPRLAVAASVRDAAREHGDDPQPVYGSSVAGLADEELPGYVDGLLADTRERAPRPDAYVPSTHLWWAEDSNFLGRVHIRHRLTPLLREAGGHLGYHVVPTHRRRGHALEIDCLLLTCDDDNVASRKVIEANGGLLQDQRGGKLRFWLPTT